MVTDNPEINSTENISNLHPLGRDHILELIADIQRIRLSLDQFETRLRNVHAASSEQESTERQFPVHEVESDSESDTEIAPKSQWGFTVGDKVHIKNVIEVGGFRIPHKYKQGVVVDFTPRFVKVNIVYKSNRKQFEKIVNREPHNVEHA